ncbi:uncharacterized protein [Leptinotarsa decemlineata]|uniref:uncharacterized protein n=1 Tax=Leptinotarsa decemlineata TaxID=7539 RepID=UPI003D309266
MESEEFYDSLEDDSEYDSIDNSIDKEQQHLNPPTDKSDDIIPFYDKDLSRSEINLSKSSSRCSAVLTGKKTANKSLKKTSENDGKLKSNSYLSMFLAKTNAGVGELRKSPGRCAMERLNLTSRSSVDSDKFEVNSLYLKFEETSDSSLDNHSTLREIPELVLSIRTQK